MQIFDDVDRNIGKERGTGYWGTQVIASDSRGTYILN